jgi:hypothetical protein
VPADTVPSAAAGIGASSGRVTDSPPALRSVPVRLVRPLLVLPLLAACSGGPLHYAAGDFNSSALDRDTGALAAGPIDMTEEGCVELPERFGETRAAPIEGQQTVLEVTWDGPAHDEAAVFYKNALGVTVAVPVLDGVPARLVGLRADVDVWVQATAVEDGVLVCSAPWRAHTGSLPAGLPEARLSQSLSGPATPAFLAVPVLTDGSCAAVIYETRSGEPVWRWTIPEGPDGSTPMYRVHVRRDGGGVLVNVHQTPHVVADLPREYDGGLYRVDWDGTWSFAAVPGATRDFVELPDGGVAILSSQVRRVEYPLNDDQSVIRGDRIIEVRPDGTQVEIWNMFDDYPHELGESEIHEDQFLHVGDWAHANGITYDAPSDDLVISLPHVQSIARIERSTGALRWQLSKMEGDFAMPGANQELVDLPHSVQVLESGNLLVLNRRDPTSCSEVVEIGLDLEAGTAEAEWVLPSDPCIFIPFLGEALRLPDGDTVAMWSSAGRLDIVSPAGVLRWRLALDLGAGFGFVSHAPTLGVPGSD